MSPEHDSPYYCPIHGIKDMLTAKNVTKYSSDLVGAQKSVDAHLARVTESKIPNLRALSRNVNARIAEVVNMDTQKLAYMNLVAQAIDRKLAEIDGAAYN